MNPSNLVFDFDHCYYSSCFNIYTYLGPIVKNKYWWVWELNKYEKIPYHSFHIYIKKIHLITEENYTQLIPPFTEILINIKSGWTPNFPPALKVYYLHSISNIKKINLPIGLKYLLIGSKNILEEHIKIPFGCEILYLYPSEKTCIPSIQITQASEHPDYPST